MNKERINKKISSPQKCNSSKPMITPQHLKGKLGASTSHCEQSADLLARHCVTQNTSNPVTLSSKQSPISLGLSGRSLTAFEHSIFDGKVTNNLNHLQIHDGPYSHLLCESINAQAFSYGNNIVMGHSYDATRESGQALLAHEVSHALAGEGVVRRKEKGISAFAEKLRSSMDHSYINYRNPKNISTDKLRVEIANWTNKSISILRSLKQQNSGDTKYALNFLRSIDTWEEKTINSQRNLFHRIYNLEQNPLAIQSNISLIRRSFYNFKRTLNIFFEMIKNSKSGAVSESVVESRSGADNYKKATNISGSISHSEAISWSNDIKENAIPAIQKISREDISWIEGIIKRDAECHSDFIGWSVKSISGSAFNTIFWKLILNDLKKCDSKFATLRKRILNVQSTWIDEERSNISTSDLNIIQFELMQAMAIQDRTYKKVLALWTEYYKTTESRRNTAENLETTAKTLEAISDVVVLSKFPGAKTLVKNAFATSIKSFLKKKSAKKSVSKFVILNARRNKGKIAKTSKILNARISKEKIISKTAKYAGKVSKQARQSILVQYTTYRVGKRSASRMITDLLGFTDFNLSAYFKEAKAEIVNSVVDVILSKFDFSNVSPGLLNRAKNFSKEVLTNIAGDIAKETLNNPKIDFGKIGLTNLKNTTISTICRGLGTKLKNSSSSFSKKIKDIDGEMDHLTTLSTKTSDVLISDTEIKASPTDIFLLKNYISDVVDSLVTISKNN